MTTNIIAQKHTKGVGVTISSKKCIARVTTATKPHTQANKLRISSLLGVQTQVEVPTSVGFHP
jgi:hypothetical protein